MIKDSFIKGLFLGLGIITIFGIIGAVSAIGFHTANEILSGTFTENYIFSQGSSGNVIQIGNTGSHTIFATETNDNETPIFMTYDGGTSANRYGIGQEQFATMIRAGTSGAIKFYTGGVIPNNPTGGSTNTQMIITSNGDVGIGTSSPASRLHVNGDIRTSSIETSNIEIFRRSQLVTEGITIPVDGYSFLHLDAASAVATSATKSIADGNNGQILILTGRTSTSPITIYDGANTRLAGDFTISAFDSLTLIWDDNANVWVELARSNN